MYVIQVPNVNYALNEGLWWLKTVGQRRESRNGPVLVSPTPVTTVYQNPCQRVLFSQLRDANPYFHLVEAMWMLAGRNDVELPAGFAKQILAYSDDGVVMNAAYGHRWRRHFGFDQVIHVINDLRRDRTTRRAVIAIWDGHHDLIAGAAGSKDLPCNTTVFFNCDPEANTLDMTICNRSNDIVWGAYGANAVHFSFLHEFVAGAAGLSVGRMYQVSNNYHMYIDRPDVQRLMDATCGDRHSWVVRYHERDMYPWLPAPLSMWTEEDGLYSPDVYLQLIEKMLAEPNADYAWPPFLRNVVRPVLVSHAAYKAGDYALAREVALHGIRSADWSLACVEWLDRRAAAREAKERKEAA